MAPKHEHHRAVQKMSGLSAQIASPDDIVTTEVLCFSLASSPRAEDALGATDLISRAEDALGTTDLVSLLRLRRVGGEPIALIHTWLARTTVPGLQSEDLVNASLHEILDTRFGIPVSAGHRQVRAVSASGNVAADMGVPNGTPLLVLEGTSQDDGGRAVEYFCTWHRGDRVVFDVDAGADRSIRHHSYGTPPPDDMSAAEGTADLRRQAEALAEALQTFAADVGHSTEE
ncbi:GntR family transcriptional regulator [Brevibacterium spongiae]|uniref:GntR family transcriptional regulator n=1 Tax=Brevibacterium spongiae TaxID=2909672 RepID=A0ABY5SRA6_9MICO|nr:GntR family transcriptional regulator [Brevibacterium spongiae]UVI36835.1 GntR family transcriptional regulator [Brevibacterium spongiae]